MRTGQCVMQIELLHELLTFAQHGYDIVVLNDKIKCPNRTTPTLE